MATHLVLLNSRNTGRLHGVMFLIHYVFFLCTGCAHLSHVVWGSLSSVCMFHFQFSVLYDKFCLNLISGISIKNVSGKLILVQSFWFIPLQNVGYIVCMKHKFTFINVVENSTPYNKQLCDTKCRLL